MSIISIALKHLIAAGLAGDELIVAISEIEAAVKDEFLKKPERNARQERNRRYYERSVLKRLNSDDQDVSDAKVSPPPMVSKPSLTTPLSKEKNPLKGVKKEIDSPQFEEFWQNYPKQRAGSKEKALAAYSQALKRASHDEIMRGLKGYLQSREVAEGFAKGGAAWLNDDRWRSDYSYGPTANPGWRPNPSHQIRKETPKSNVGTL